MVAPEFADGAELADGSGAGVADDVTVGSAPLDGSAVPLQATRLTQSARAAMDMLVRAITMIVDSPDSPIRVADVGPFRTSRSACVIPK